jgi:cyclophilin family peptidyl-prolyl cis-trans isomerase
MHNVIRSGTLLFLLVLLTGCSTDEVRKKELVTDLVLDSEKKAVEEAAAKVKAEEETLAKEAAQKTKVTEPMYKEAPTMQIEAETKTYQATLSTDKGDITIELDAKATPITVNNFVFLARQNFYNNTPFHRTIPGFMIQGGDPTGTGTGGPGYKFSDEPFSGEYKKGTVAMANSGPNTNGSQFFIMHKDTALPKSYVIFGQVIEGIEVVDAIAEAPTQAGGEGSSPVELVYIKNVTIEEEVIKKQSDK